MRNIGIFGVSAFGQGPWRPGKNAWAIASVGVSEIGFRPAQLDEGATIVNCVTLLGTSKVVAPSEMPMTLAGLSILGIRSTKETPHATAKSLKASCITFGEPSGKRTRPSLIRRLDGVYHGSRQPCCGTRTADCSTSVFLGLLPSQPHGPRTAPLLPAT